MELRVKKHEGRELSFDILGETETLINPLKARLLLDDDVEVAEYLFEHPQLSVPTFVIRTAKGDPQKALVRAVKSLHKDLKDFEAQLAAQSPGEGAQTVRV